MAANSAISWTDHTWNPWIGCTKVSPACDHCYAEAWAKRYGRAEWGDHPRQRTSAATWRQPLKWNKETPGAFVFCASLADIFDNQVDPQWRRDAFEVMRATPRLTYLLLTKRPGNIDKLAEAAGGLPPNAAIGCTVVTQDEANRDVPILLASGGPHRVRFVSIEPMLEAIDLRRLREFTGKPIVNALRGLVTHGDYLARSPSECSHNTRTQISPPELPALNWVICGGESGPGARPIDPDWVRSLRDQCAAADVPFHFKQWGGFTAKAGGKTLDGREWCERPKESASEPSK